MVTQSPPLFNLFPFIHEQNSLRYFYQNIFGFYFPLEGNKEKKEEMDSQDSNKSEIPGQKLDAKEKNHNSTVDTLINNILILAKKNTMESATF